MSQPPDQFLPRPPQPVESLQALDAAPRPVERPHLGHYSYELPTGVMDSAHWQGSDADRFFSLEEPSFEKLTEILRNTDAANLSTKVPDFVRAIGKLGPDGLVMRDDAGKPALRPIDYIEATRWLARLGTKGKFMVAAQWTDLFSPSNAEGEALRGSKVRLG